MFYVGQKVACVDDRPFSSGSPSNLVKGTIYTVCEVFFRGDVDPEDGLRFARDCLRLHEYPHCRGGGLAVTRFRPLTDISVFTDMLNRAPSPEHTGTYEPALVVRAYGLGG